jgi:hypothetical protein
MAHKTMQAQNIQYLLARIPMQPHSLLLHANLCFALGQAPSLNRAQASQPSNKNLRSNLNEIFFIFITNRALWHVARAIKLLAGRSLKPHEPSTFYLLQQ